jgi:putative sterol carrier protein
LEDIEMTISSPREFIETVLPKKLNDPEKLKGINMSLQFLIKGDDGGEWILDIHDQRAETKEGTVDKPKITIKMKDKNFVKMVNGQLSGQKAFMTGKLKFKGDMATALKLQKLGII